MVNKREEKSVFAYKIKGQHLKGGLSGSLERGKGGDFSGSLVRGETLR